MKKRKKNNGLLTVLIILAALLLCGEAAFLILKLGSSRPAALSTPSEPETTVQTEPETTEPETTEPELVIAEIVTQPETVPETEETTEPETTEPETEPETEPQEERFLLTFAGDCTLGTDPRKYDEQYQFIWTIGDDYEFPFRNVAEYFRNDDFTFVNLEGNFSDEKRYSDSQFSFRGPTAYTQILTSSSIEVVTLANNHTMDFGKAGYQDTTDALDAAGIPYAEKDRSMMYTTESGLTIGIYGCAFSVNGAHCRSEIQKMRAQGADIIIVAIHWGEEGKYHPSSGQISFAHEAIDYGADIVYGSHPHVLQPVEEYKDGVIFYSMGNFSFGGHTWPPDLDSAILQQEVIREADGSVHLGELIRIPVRISSIQNSGQNNFQPTPYEEDSDGFLRVLSKLDGTWKGADLQLSY